MLSGFHHTIILLSLDYLKHLEYHIFNTGRKLVYVNQTLVELIEKIQRKYDVFGRFFPAVYNVQVPSGTWVTDDVFLYSGYSLAYTVSNAYLDKLGKIIRKFIDENP